MSQGLITMNGRTPSSRRCWRPWVAPVIALSLGACGVDRAATGSIQVASNDYAETHPIRLAEAPVTMDIFPGSGRMDRATDMRIKEFAANYRVNGVGPLQVLFPAGAETGMARDTLPEIRKSLASGGARGALSVGSYPAEPDGSAAPIRLSFRALKARVANRCGEWPADLASGSSVDGWNNRPYWNFGCAYQTAFATQVADPRDFAAPRAEAPSDVEMRRRGIEKVRQGADPGSTWKTTNSNIGGVGN